MPVGFSVAFFAGVTVGVPIGSEDFAAGSR